MEEKNQNDLDFLVGGPGDPTQILTLSHGPALESSGAPVQLGCLHLGEITKP